MTGVFRDTDAGLVAKSAVIRAQLEQLQQDENLASARLADAIARMEQVSSRSPPNWTLRVFCIGVVVGTLTAFVSGAHP